MNLKIVTLTPTEPIKLTSSTVLVDAFSQFYGVGAISQLTTGDIHTLGTRINTMEGGGQGSKMEGENLPPPVHCEVG